MGKSENYKVEKKGWHITFLRLGISLYYFFFFFFNTLLHRVWAEERFISFLCVDSYWLLSRKPGPLLTTYACILAPTQKCVLWMLDICWMS